LPTSRSAKFSSGLGVTEFLKRTSIIGCDENSLAKITQSAEILAGEEGLIAHARSLAMRNKEI
jgi:histidinol dehydrogenase